MSQRHKHYEAITGYAEGKPIQVRHPSCSAWHDCPEPRFDKQMEYRIKPEETKAGFNVYWSKSMNCVVGISKSKNLELTFDDNGKLIKAEVLNNV